MYNPIIIIAILAQWLIAKFNRVAGAIAGFIITAGIMLWGISVYSDGGAITLFGLELSAPVFVVICLVWFGFDYMELQNARKAAAMPAIPAAAPAIIAPAAAPESTAVPSAAAEDSKQD